MCINRMYRHTFIIFWYFIFFGSFSRKIFSRAFSPPYVSQKMHFTSKKKKGVMVTRFKKRRCVK